MGFNSGFKGLMDDSFTEYLVCALHELKNGSAGKPDRVNSAAI